MRQTGDSYDYCSLSNPFINPDLMLFEGAINLCLVDKAMGINYEYEHFSSFECFNGLGYFHLYNATWLFSREARLHDSAPSLKTVDFVKWSKLK